MITLSIPNRAKRAAVIMLFVLLACTYIFFGLAIYGYADETVTTIEQGIASGAEDVYDVVKAVATPIAVAFFAWAALKALFGGEKGMETAKKTFFICGAGIALVWLAPVVVKQIQGWFNAIGDQGVFTINSRFFST